MNRGEPGVGPAKGKYDIIYVPKELKKEGEAFALLLCKRKGEGIIKKIHHSEGKLSRRKKGGVSSATGERVCKNLPLGGRGRGAKGKGPCGGSIVSPSVAKGNK